MKYRTFGLIVCAALGTNAKAQEPLTVFGIGFDQPLKMAECEWKTRDKLRISRSEPKSKENFYSGGWPKDGPCYERSPRKVGSAMALDDETVSIKFPLSQEPKLGHDLYARMVDGRIQRLWLTTFGVATQEQDLAMLEEKFGKPNKLLTPSEQNMMGAKFDTIQAEWKLPGNVTAAFGSVLGKLTEGTFILATPEGEANYRAAMESIYGQGTKL